MNLPTHSKNRSASQIVSAGKDQQTIVSLTNRWNASLGKSAENILETAAILHDAKAKIVDKDSYENWLKKVAKMHESTASKNRSIHENEFLHDSSLTANLPPDWTVWYELSQLRTIGLFKKGVAFVESHAPTHAELSTTVRDLAGKKPKEKLYRTGKLVTNKQKIVAEVKRQTAKAKEEADEAKAEAKQAKAEEEKAKKELAAIKKLEAILAKAKSKKRDDEPTPEQMRKEQEFDYDDGDNLVRVETFKAKYTEIQKKKLQRKEVQKKIAEVLHAQGLHHVEAIIRDRQIPMMVRKAA
jgi:hypothetical protein